MQARVEKYCEVYTNDLAHSIGLRSKFLPQALNVPVLLNPLFGLQSMIVWTGLLKHLQYTRTRYSKYWNFSLNYFPCETLPLSLVALIRNMQDILDKTIPPISDDSGNKDSEDGEDEEPVTAQVNSNTKADEELLLFKSWKRKTYRSTCDASRSHILAGIDDDSKKHEILIG